MKTPSFGPVCPNHKEPLEDIPFPMPSKGEGRCPVSGEMFAYEVEVDEEKQVVDKFGNVTKAIDWKLEGND